MKGQLAGALPKKKVFEKSVKKKKRNNYVTFSGKFNLTFF